MSVLYRVLFLRILLRPRPLRNLSSINAPFSCFRNRIFVSVSQIPESSDGKLIDGLVDVNAVRLHIFFFISFRFISCFFARASGGAAALRFGLDAGVAAGAAAGVTARVPGVEHFSEKPLVNGHNHGYVFSFLPFLFSSLPPLC